MMFTQNGGATMPSGIPELFQAGTLGFLAEYMSSDVRPRLLGGIAAHSSHKT